MDNLFLTFAISFCDWYWGECMRSSRLGSSQLPVMTPTSWWWLELHFHEQHKDLPFTLSHYPSFLSLFFIFISTIFFSALSETIGQCLWVWMLWWQFNKSALLLAQDRVWADCWPPHSRGGAWARKEAAAAMQGLAVNSVVRIIIV